MSDVGGETTPNMATDKTDPARIRFLPLRLFCTVVLLGLCCSMLLINAPTGPIVFGLSLGPVFWVWFPWEKLKDV